MIPKFTELEEQILAGWKEKNIFQKTLAQTSQGKRFVFFEGPPTANGLPHIGHVLARIFKDIICRYKTMRGFFVERKAGWDTQGLPVELEVEEQIGVSGKRDIEKFGIEKFNQACRESVWKYKAEWEKLTERIGYWLDLENPYITYEKSYIETLWWIFRKLWEKELLIKDYKVVPHCPRCETALSSHEVAQGYERVKENSVYLKFKVTSDKGQVTKGDYILSWTTTPWTLPGNVALTVKPDARYVILPENDKGERYIVAQERVGIISDYLGQELPAVTKSAQIIYGSDLVGLEYEPLFPGAIPENAKGYENAYKVYAADFVTMADGTGVVHTAVMYGEDDYNLGQKVGLPKHHTVTSDGHFTADVPEFAGQYVKDKKTEEAIVESLKKRNLLYKEELYEHDYPYCWRCHSPLLYYAKDSWFIAMSKLREELLKNNEQINWVPEYIKHGRFGEWLNEIKDWAISRERYWGTPIPIWECGKCGQRECIGSYQELVDKTGSKEILSDSFDPHRPFIDAITWKCQCGGEMKRIAEVADTWFDSGSMPFAQWHYPFENKERIDKGVSFPADYIAEAIDQTRGWFYTLLAVSTALGYDIPPYQNDICLGHVLDAKGLKMSKHLGNVVNPWDAIQEFGIDPIRWYLFTVNQPGEYKRFDPEGIREVVRKNFILLWNVVNFYLLFHPPKNPPALEPAKSHVLDRWITARLHELTETVTIGLDRYQVISAARPVNDFIADLSTWYVRRSRERFKGDDQPAAVQTLGYVLNELAKLLAPFTPFLAEAIYRQIGGQKESVHLEAWPEKSLSEADRVLLSNMVLVRQIVELAHAARAEKNLKVRQPLASLAISAKTIAPELSAVLKDEVNVFEIKFVKTLPEGNGWIQKKSGETAIALETNLTPELTDLGLVRELVRQINNLRKQLRLTRQDTICLGLDAGPLSERLAKYQDQLMKDTIAAELKFGRVLENEWEARAELTHESVKLKLGLRQLT